MTEALKLRLINIAESIDAALEVAEWLSIHIPSESIADEIATIRHIGGIVTVCRAAARALEGELEELSVEGDTP